MNVNSKEGRSMKLQSVRMSTAHSRDEITPQRGGLLVRPMSHIYLVGRCLSAPSEPLWRYPWLESERRRPPSTAAHSWVINPSQASIATIVTNLKLCGDHAGSAREAAARAPVHGHAIRSHVPLETWPLVLLQRASPPGCVRVKTARPHLHSFAPSRESVCVSLTLSV